MNNYEERYKRIINMLAGGHSPAAVCQALNISKRTITRARAWGKANNYPAAAISNNTQPRSTPGISNQTQYATPEDDKNTANEFFGGDGNLSAPTTPDLSGDFSLEVNIGGEDVTVLGVEPDIEVEEEKPIKPYNYLKVNGLINIEVGGKIATYDESSEQFKELSAAIDSQDWAKVKEIVGEPEAIEGWVSGSGDVEFRGGELYYKGFHYTNPLVSRIKECMKKGAEPTVLLNFFENLAQNPLMDSVQQLFRFLEHNNLPLTKDGHFLAYKKVRDNYKDIHSGTMDNRVGCVVEMPRNQVQHNKNQTCSAGLHFCSKSYLGHFGTYGNNRVVILKINPKDVVSIPTDYNNAKGRACRYEVVADLPADGSIPDGYCAEY